MMMDASKLSLYLVTDRGLAQERDCDLEWIVGEAVRGGVTIVQLREKELGTKEFVQMGKRLKVLLGPLGIPLIINDRIDVALACDADGVHIGQSDMPYSVARGLLGPDKIIGLSIETFEQLEEANGLDVDYVAASPVFGTPTKTDTARPWGLDGLREFCRRSVHPVVAIGGINAGNAAAVRSCGADGLAVVSAIISAPSPKSAAAEIADSATKQGSNVANSPIFTDLATKQGSNVADSPIFADSATKQGSNVADSLISTDLATKQGSNVANSPIFADLATKQGPNVADSLISTDSATKQGSNVANSPIFTDLATKLGSNVAKPMGEFEMIDKIRAVFGDVTVVSGRNGIVGIGDDCAIIPQHRGTDTLVSTDLLIEGVHFLLDDISPRDLGWKSAAVNISDIAAMGGRPTATFLSIALPENLGTRPAKVQPENLGTESAKELPENLGAEPGEALPVKQKNSITIALPTASREEWVNEFIAGYKEISEQFGVPLMGGDTTSSKGPLAINVAILGEVPSGTAKLRSAAKPGDLICVTGTLGDSAAGLQLILKKSTNTANSSQRDIASAAWLQMILRDQNQRPSKEKISGSGLPKADTSQNIANLAAALATRHHRPMPRIQEGLKLRECPGVHAMMDISDGIGSDLRHILKASGVGAEVDLGRIPLSKELLELCAQMPELDPYELACSGGEDYELLFTMTPGSDPGIPYTVIGRITENDTAFESPSGANDSTIKDSTGGNNNTATGSNSNAPKNSTASIKWLGSDKDFKGFHHF